MMKTTFGVAPFGREYRQDEGCVETPIRFEDLPVEILDTIMLQRVDQCPIAVKLAKTSKRFHQAAFSLLVHDVKTCLQQTKTSWATSKQRPPMAQAIWLDAARNVEHLVTLADEACLSNRRQSTWLRSRYAYVFNSSNYFEAFDRLRDGTWAPRNLRHACCTREDPQDDPHYTKKTTTITGLFEELSLTGPIALCEQMLTWARREPNTGNCGYAYVAMQRVVNCYMTGATHLDLSWLNLLNAPPGLMHLTTLRKLNLAHNDPPLQVDKPLMRRPDALIASLPKLRIICYGRIEERLQP